MGKKCMMHTAAAHAGLLERACAPAVLGFQPRGQ
jgi:hypothetical protein